jgi:excisionase family DNA binding protein
MDKDNAKKTAPLIRYALLNRERYPDLELTVAEAAVLLGVGDEQIRVWARQEKLKGIHFGKEWRFTWQALDDLKLVLAVAWLSGQQRRKSRKAAQLAPAIPCAPTSPLTP